MVAVKKEGGRGGHQRKKRVETENADSGVYFRRRKKKERGGDGVGSMPCGLVCYRANEHE